MFIQASWLRSYSLLNSFEVVPFFGYTLTFLGHPICLAFPSLLGPSWSCFPLYGSCSQALEISCLDVKDEYQNLCSSHVIGKWLPGILFLYPLYKLGPIDCSGTNSVPCNWRELKVYTVILMFVESTMTVVWFSVRPMIYFLCVCEMTFLSPWWSMELCCLLGMWLYLSLVFFYLSMSNTIFSLHAIHIEHVLLTLAL